MVQPSGHIKDAGKQVRQNTDTHARARTHTHTHTRARARAHPHTHTCTRAHRCRHPPTQSRTRAPFARAPQVHDIEGRVAAVEALLRSKGFDRVAVLKEPRFRDCNLFMVYGSRQRPRGGAEGPQEQGREEQGQGQAREREARRRDARQGSAARQRRG